MKDTDFLECPFIKEQLRFLTFIDFCNNATIIKMHYTKLSKNGKIFYKWFVYSNIHIDEYHKNLIWTFLNEEDMQSYAMLLENIKTYRVR